MLCVCARPHTHDEFCWIWHWIDNLEVCRFKRILSSHSRPEVRQRRTDLSLLQLQVRNRNLPLSNVLALLLFHLVKFRQPLGKSLVCVGDGPVPVGGRLGELLLELRLDVLLERLVLPVELCEEAVLAVVLLEVVIVIWAESGRRGKDRRDGGRCQQSDQAKEDEREEKRRGRC